MICSPEIDFVSQVVPNVFLKAGESGCVSKEIKDICTRSLCTAEVFFILQLSSFSHSFFTGASLKPQGSIFCKFARCN